MFENRKNVGSLLSHALAIPLAIIKTRRSSTYMCSSHFAVNLVSKT